MKTFAFILFGMALRCSGQTLVYDAAAVGQLGSLNSKLSGVMQELQKANRTLTEIDERLGASTKAVKRLRDEHTYLSTIGDHAAPANQVERFSSKTQPDTTFRASPNRFRQNKPTSATIWGRVENRERSLYDENLRQEGAVLGVRQMVDENRAHQRTLMTHLLNADDRMRAAETLADIVASQADFTRLQIMMMSAAAVTQNAVNDYHLAEAQRSLAKEHQALRQAEVHWMERYAYAQNKEQARQEWGRLLQRGRTLIKGEEIAWDKVLSRTPQAPGF